MKLWLQPLRVQRENGKTMTTEMKNRNVTPSSLREIREEQAVPKRRKTNAWLEHVNKFRTKFKELSYKEVLEKAGETYTKQEKMKKEAGAPRKVNPWMEHIKEWIQKNPDWKVTHTYKEVLVLCKDTYKSPKAIIKVEPMVAL